MNADQLKRKAAERAVELIEDGMKLGLGTGSTARHVLEVIAEKRANGELQNIRGVPTSSATRDQANQLGIPVTTLDDLPHLDLAIDGADEVDPDLNLVKGLGGALLWEKIVESAADRLVIVVDESKLVDRLCEKAPLPVEVVQFAWSTHMHFLKQLGGSPSLRKNGMEPFVTDSGNYIIDCSFDDGIADPWLLQTEIRNRAGIVESGLFLDMAEQVIVASATGVRTLLRSDA
ncbi:MAG TPA: ribose-5-phosphate isomerase RpiA [Longimicrobiales bacterium]|nr:ribose-5-phosphate isomerase RpiA [Longimicrobiales bacterium]